MIPKKIVFNKPFMTGEEIDNITHAYSNFMLAGDGEFTKFCNRWLEEQTTCHKALLTHSCTAAIEMAALLLDIQPGDEIIMPSFTFVSTANAFVLRGGIPVFIDIRKDTLNIDEKLIEKAITGRTRAIVVVHYAGVACEMDEIMQIAGKHGLKVIEDAAHGVMASYKGRPLGSIGELGAFSFHETKNVISGEGGALLINDPQFSLQAEMIREKGTDRSQFFRGEIDKYTWQTVGSSYLPGELIASFLWAQLCHAEEITRERVELWDRYHEMFKEIEEQGLLRRPIVPEGCIHNAHMYYLLLDGRLNRDRILRKCNSNGVNVVFHYVPLHSSPAGQRYGRVVGSMDITDRVSDRLIRLPLWIGLTNEQQQRVFNVLTTELPDAE